MAQSSSASVSNITMGLANLHDAFLQASLQRKYMEQSPVIREPTAFMVSDRGRFERVWVALLYVLVESWQSKQMRPIREYVGTVTSVAELERVLLEGKRGGFLARMRETRHYVCHRDKREYWDQGRFGVAGGLKYHIKLHDAFSKVLLAAMKRRGSE